MKLKNILSLAIVGSLCSISVAFADYKDDPSLLVELGQETHELHALILDSTLRGQAKAASWKFSEEVDELLSCMGLAGGSHPPVANCDQIFEETRHSWTRVEGFLHGLADTFPRIYSHYIEVRNLFEKILGISGLR